MPILSFIEHTCFSYLEKWTTDDKNIITSSTFCRSNDVYIQNNVLRRKIYYALFVITFLKLYYYEIVFYALFVCGHYFAQYGFIQVCICRGMETNFEKGTGPESRRTIVVEDKILIKTQLRRRDAALHL